MNHMPTGPSAHLPSGPSALTFPMLRYMRDPATYYREGFRRYGDPFTTPGPFGQVVATADPEGVRQLYSADPDLFDAGVNAALLGDFIGDRSVILLSGAEHRRERKLLMPPFHGERMRAYGEIMQATTRRIAAGLPRGETFSMLRATQRIALDIMVEAVLGVSIENQPDLAARITSATLAHVEAMVPSIVFFPALRSRFMPPWSRFVRARARLDEVVYELIAARRAAPAGQDVLSLLLAARYDDGSAMGDKEVRDELLTLLFAGHETTAIATAWAMYFLHRDAFEMDRLRAELADADESPEAIARLPRLEAVCHEALRVHPVVVDVPRTLRQPFRFMGYDLPAGVTVSATPLALHAREASYPDAGSFRPGRFLGFLGSARPSQWEFLPFGAGSRRCIGAAFAQYEMKIVLATLLREHRLRLASETPERSRRRGFVMAPERGVPMMWQEKGGA